jgi:hypothetical protein
VSSVESATALLRLYVNDMLAVDKHILEAIERQAADVRLQLFADVSVLVGDIAQTLRSQISELEPHVAALGGESGALLKTAVTSVAGAVAGLYDKVRKDPVSRMLRDDYTALNLAAISYGMLYTTGIALSDKAVANVSQRHLGQLTRLVIRLNQVIPGVVVTELAQDGHTVEENAGTTGRETIEQAWRNAP